MSPIEIFGIFNLVEAFWIVIPAYAANGLAPFAKFTSRTPIDKGKTWRDGRPIFGAGKTWEGSIIGVVMAVFIASFMGLAFYFLPWDLSPIPLDIAPMGPVLGFMLGLGAITGDIAKSFFKRRIGFQRGRSFPVVDQLDFILGAFLFASVVAPVKISWVILLAIVTPLFHLSANYMAYLAGVKKEPW